MQFFVHHKLQFLEHVWNIRYIRLLNYTAYSDIHVTESQGSCEGVSSLIHVKWAESQPLRLSMQVHYINYSEFLFVCNWKSNILIFYHEEGFIIYLHQMSFNILEK